MTMVLRGADREVSGPEWRAQKQTRATHPLIFDRDTKAIEQRTVFPQTVPEQLDVCRQESERPPKSHALYKKVTHYSFQTSCKAN